MGKKLIFILCSLLAASSLHISHCVRVTVLRVESGAPFGIFDIYSNASLSGYLTSEKNGKQYIQYKSDIINDWTLTNIQKVIINVYRRADITAFFEFDGKNTNNKNWMSKSRLLNSSYTDINPSILTFAQISFVDSRVIRRFYISSWHAYCNGDSGWLVVIESTNIEYCKVDQVKSTTIWYSNLEIKKKFNGFKKADIMTVDVDIDVTCDKDVLLVANSSHSLTGIQYNDTVTYQCLVGFCHTSGDLMRRCTHLGLWSGSSPICKQCIRHCKQAEYIQSNDTDAIEASVKKIKSELSIKANETYIAQLKKRCAADTRPSATAVGSILGGVVLGSFVLLIVVNDAAVLLNHFKIAYNNIR